MDRVGNLAAFVLHRLRRVSVAWVLAVATAGAGAVGLPDDLPRHFPGFETLADDPYCPQCSLQQAGGKSLIAGRMGRAFAVVRVQADGSPDPGFGDGGMVVLPVWGSRHDIAEILVGLDDGRIVVAGNAKDFVHSDCYFRSECASFAAIFRLLPDGTLDPSFDADGRLVLRIGEPHTSGNEVSPTSLLGSLGRGTDGELLLYNATRSALPVAAIRADGTVRIIASSRPVVQAQDFTAAVEFRHRGLDRYFVTADPYEAALLDRAPDTPWTATGYGFVVYPPGSEVAGTVPACRFYGRPEAGIDAHFVSVNAEECTALESDPRWIVETREAFRVARPDAVDGTCPLGFTPVYRFWNARRGVGHRLVTDFLVTSMQVQPDYVAEGWGPDGVAMCSPP